MGGKARQSMILCSFPASLSDPFGKHSLSGTELTLDHVLKGVGRCLVFHPSLVPVLELVGHLMIACLSRVRLCPFA